MAHPFLAPSPYEADGGHLIGRDPRTIPAHEWRAVMPDPLVGLAAIRAKCLDCCGGNAAEVRKCVCVACPLWPLRMGSQPAGMRVARQTAPEPATADAPTLTE
ncbi:hypothetical protein [Rubellimicrobium sp. CFH 75288]|uniref:hypothetical protein n=1 Tax=Rubellimicrobium sp. CFH 75288 TaxID=2697034 RepID=UPI001412FB92|nr:hypothetical protein [Rubellimicrobium sp. CFH 75288]NAZ37189.1 hypothetical protein [Rubellimicrobium sp. CFH 75288]